MLATRSGIGVCCVFGLCVTATAAGAPRIAGGLARYVRHTPNVVQGFMDSDGGLSSAADPAATAQARQGGDTCALAMVINSLPYDGIGTTVGYTNDYDAICPHNTPGSPDVVYAYAPPADVAVDLSLCDPNETDYDTKLYVFADDCTTAPVACNDDACPGYRSQILGLTLSAGRTYFIVVDGYGGAAGNYRLTVTGSAPPPACPEGSLFSQPAAEPSDSWFAGKSDVATGYLRYESYAVAEGMSIAGLRVWGLRLYYSGSWSACGEDPMPFEIKFYPDVSGLPGAATCSYSVSANGYPAGQVFNGFPLYRYDIELGSPCMQQSGWVSVQGAGDPLCWFLWMSSPTGNGKSLVDSGGGPTIANYDLSLCLSGGPAVCPGDLNCDGQIDFADINPFVLYLSNNAAWLSEFPGCNPLNGDINGDGTYGQGSLGDINPFVALFASHAPPIPCP